MTKRLAVAMISGIVFLAALAGVFELYEFVITVAETKLMVLHKNGAEKPDDFGAASETIWIQSASRKLEAFVVRASATCLDNVALLIFHGRGETISDWARVQAFLSKQCISSLVFDYSGHGSSTPPANISTLNADAVAAYDDFAERFPRPGRRCIFGHSMGAAPMLNAYVSMRPRPDCTVVASGFSSLQDTAHADGTPTFISALLRYTWNNVMTIKAVQGPLLIIHSDSDEVIPAYLAARLDAAAPTGATHVTVSGFGHNDVYKDPAFAWWRPVLTFLRK